ncbi:MAG: AAA family ATPase [Bacillota bacterium]|nr:AAA family ATPase [Bacillota bacterium]
MALEAMKPKVSKNRLKLFMYGNAKVGKTTLSIQFPKPYIIDTEGTTDKSKYVDLINKSNGVVLITQDFDKLVEQVKDLLTLKHDYKTLVIDSLTILYNDLLDKSAIKVGTEFGRHYGEANKKMKHLVNLLLRLDMNVIITSHAKNEYGANLSVLGSTFDCYKKLDYIFDLILEVQKRGKDRVALIKGTRLIEFPEDDAFPCNYEEFSKRYDKESLERNAIPEKLASQDQVSHLKYLIDLYKESEDTVQKWLDKAKAQSLNELSEDVTLKLITHMENKPKQKGEAA